MLLHADDIKYVINFRLPLVRGPIPVERIIRKIEFLDSPKQRKAKRGRDANRVLG